MGTPSAEDAVQAFLAAYNAHDIAAVAELFATDAVYADVGTGHTYEGKEQVVAYVQAAFETLPDCRWQLESIVASGDKAAFEGTYTGTLPPGVGGNTTSAERPMTLNAATVVDTRDGLIVRLADYHNYSSPAS